MNWEGNVGETQLQLNWDYDASVAKMRVLKRRFQDVSVEFLDELYRAREELSQRAATRERDSTGAFVPVEHDWEGYCDDIGLKKRTANRWLAVRRLFVEDQTGNVHFSSATAEWYTPETIIERTRQLFGGTIELDPCSNDGESPHVPAEKVFTKDDDGLNQEWFGTVYMNPPYGRVIEQWIDKLCDEYEAGRIREAIALVPARTDTVWFRRMAAYPRLFIWGRLQFSGHENSAPFPSMLVYLGPNIVRFKATFADIGDLYVRA